MKLINRKNLSVIFYNFKIDLLKVLDKCTFHGLFVDMDLAWT